MTRKVIYTENPDKALWWRLAHFKNVDRIAPLIRSLHSTGENAKKQARQIRYCLEQAEEYFQSALAVTVATKPLPLYYGMASLGWALVLFKRTGDYSLDRLQKIKPGHQEHGLERPHLDYGIRNLGLPEMLEAIRTEVRPVLSGPGPERELRGTFGLLHSVVDYEPFGIKWIVRRGVLTSTATQTLSVGGDQHTSESLSGYQLHLSWLLLQIPDMASYFAELGLRPPFAYCSEAKVEQTHGDPTRTLSLVTSRMTEEEVQQLRARFAERPGGKLSDAPGGLVYQATFREGEEVKIPQLMETSDGRLYFYIPAKPSPLPELCALLAAMFLLGMLVRYYPHIWMQLLDDRHPIVEIVEAFIPIAQRKYPNLVLNNLAGDSFVFRHP